MWLIGREFRVGEALFRGQHYCDPCLRPSRLSGKEQKFLEAFLDRGGLVAEIVESGTIRKEDRIMIKRYRTKDIITETVKIDKRTRGINFVEL